MTISLKKGFEIHRDRLEQKDTKKYICDIITKLTGQNIGLSFIMEDELVVLDDDTNEKKDPVQKLKQVLPKEIFDMVEIIDE